MPIVRRTLNSAGFNPSVALPFQLRVDDFRLAMQDVYDFFFDVNTGLQAKGLERLDEQGIEIKTTRKAGGAVDTHGARDQWMCVFVYAVDGSTEPAVDRRAMGFSEVYLGRVVVDDFRKNARGELGTRTATLHAAGIAKQRGGWVYRDPAAASLPGGSARRAASRGKAAQPSLK